MTITAKYASTCPACGHAITPGTRVEWSKGSRARHTNCGAPHVSRTASRSTERCYYGHTSPVRSCRDCFDVFDY